MGDEGCGEWRRFENRYRGPCGRWVKMGNRAGILCWALEWMNAHSSGERSSVIWFKCRRLYQYVMAGLALA